MDTLSHKWHKWAWKSLGHCSRVDVYGGPQKVSVWGPFIHCTVLIYGVWSLKHPPTGFGHLVPRGRCSCGRLWKLRSSAGEKCYWGKGMAWDFIAQSYFLFSTSYLLMPCEQPTFCPLLLPSPGPESQSVCPHTANLYIASCPVFGCSHEKSNQGTRDRDSCISSHCLGPLNARSYERRGVWWSRAFETLNVEEKKLRSCFGCPSLNHFIRGDPKKPNRVGS